ncbi:CsbD family protein [Rufibacter immobilis]|uniref:CsbD family protein n=1 Tax=Rufibacter immobilis TaxID=1348778 RepID=UPI0035E77672
MRTHETEYRARGNWNEIKGKIKMAYADLTEDDLTYDEGQEDKWIGKLKQKLGKTEHELKTWLGSL